MAGAGYKLFNTGDVLTAAQVNTYLMQQTVMVFADSSARTTALSGVLAEGMVSYLQDTNTLEVYDGSGWVGATGDITGLTAGTGISISSATGPVPTITNTVATEFDSKGDLIVGTGSDAFDRLGVGNDGESIVADSSTSTGLRWQGNYAAGKNLQINGNMNIAQRGTTFAGVVNDYTLDRYNCRNNNLGVFTVSKETDAPVGFGSSMKWLCTTADASPAASDFAVLRTTLEGQQLQGLAKGTASAKTTVMSFWVKSNLTGTYLFSIFDADNTRRISATYTINASGTWEKKSIVIAGDTTGLLDNDANASMQLQWVLGSGTDRTSGTYQSTWGANVTANEWAGQTANLAATLNNYWMITGIQWEIGNVATDFQLSSGTLAGEFQAASRYYQVIGGTASGFPLAAGYTSTTGAQIRFPIYFGVPMRVAPTITKNGTWNVGNAQQPSAVFISSQGFSIQIEGLAAGNAYAYPDSTDDTFTISAEL